MVWGSDYAKHIIIDSHLILVHEQLASEGFVVELFGEIAHLVFKIVALLDDETGEVLFEFWDCEIH